MLTIVDYKPKLFLTYDNQASMDGVGAQLQRVISVFSISKLARVGYLHSPLFDIDPQVFSPLKLEERLPQINTWNDLFRDDLEEFHQVGRDRVYESDSISLLHLRLMRFVSRFSRSRIIYRLSNPRIITDKYPESLLVALDLMNDSFRNEIYSKEGNDLSIVVHIRQGELVLTQFKDRLLPLIHYERILRCVVNCLNRKDIKFRIMIPRENGQNTSLNVNDPKVARSIALDPNNTNLRINEDESITLIHEKPNPESTPILFEAQWMDESSTYSDFLQMVRADVLITSKSSLSFVAGLMNNRAIKIYTPFWHKAPKDWINSDELNEEVFSRKLRQLLPKDTK